MRAEYHLYTLAGGHHMCWSFLTLATLARAGHQAGVEPALDTPHCQMLLGTLRHSRDCGHRGWGDVASIYRDTATETAGMHQMRIMMKMHTVD